MKNFSSDLSIVNCRIHGCPGGLNQLNVYYLLAKQQADHDSEQIQYKFAMLYGQFFVSRLVHITSHQSTPSRLQFD